MKEFVFVSLCSLLFVPATAWPDNQELRCSGFADTNTVALWLFDENRYPHTTLTDAGSHGFDLRLMESGDLAPGKFGNGLVFRPGGAYNVCFAERGNEALLNRMRRNDKKPGGLWGPTRTPETLVETLVSKNWTCEFWLKLDAPLPVRGTLIQMGLGYTPGFSLTIDGIKGAFIIEDGYAGAATECPVPAAILADGAWHHFAIEYVAGRKEFRLYLDGVAQPTPRTRPIELTPRPAEPDVSVFDPSGNYERFRASRFNVSLGEDLKGKDDLAGMLDELRFSSVARYEGTFPVPSSFSRAYSRKTGTTKDSSTPSLLFAVAPNGSPIQLGARKYLIIDDTIVASKENVKVAVNPPTDFQVVDASFHSDFGVLDHDGRILVIDPDGYSSKEGLVRLWSSEDGLHFTAPELGVVDYQGSTRNNIVLKDASLWGCAFEDHNPACPSEERFKMMAWLESRGIYLYLSPDASHWRRNETCSLPLVSGGNAETFWDDQRGKYVMFIKRDGSFKTPEYPGGGRRASLFETDDATRPWPFNALDKPYFETRPFPAVTGEGPVAFPVTEQGEVYRTRAIKYAWAPDTYLAFVWRFERPDQIRQTELNVSRDGIHWTGLAGAGMYLPNGGTFAGKEIVETLAQYGLIRRADIIWQYYTLGTAPHGKGARTVVRTTQRLDGFVSVDAGTQPGTVITKPLIFEGTRLTLNVAATGWLRIALLDESEKPLAGFNSDDCDPVQSDSTHQVVSWRGKTDLHLLAGKPIILKFTMQEAKLFACQFTTK